MLIFCISELERSSLMVLTTAFLPCLPSSPSRWWTLRSQESQERSSQSHRWRNQLLQQPNMNTLSFPKAVNHSAKATLVTSQYDRGMKTNNISRNKHCKFGTNLETAENVHRLPFEKQTKCQRNHIIVTHHWFKSMVEQAAAQAKVSPPPTEEARQDESWGLQRPCAKWRVTRGLQGRFLQMTCLRLSFSLCLAFGFCLAMLGVPRFSVWLESWFRVPLLLLRYLLRSLKI